MSDYKVAIELVMNNGVSTVLSKLASEFLGLHAKAKDVEKSLGAWKGLIAGAGATFIGGKLLKGLDEAINKSRQLYNLHLGMQQRGFEDAPKLFDNRARELTGKYKNLNIEELEHVMSDTLPIFTSPEKTVAEFEPIAKMMSVLKSKYGGEESKQYLKEAVAALKSAEAAGFTKPEDLDKHLNELLKMRFQFGDLVPINTYLTAQRNMGAAYRNTDDAFKYGIFPAMQEDQGQRAGTMLNTLANKFVVGIRNSSESLELMQQLELAKAKDLKFNSKGQPTGVLPGHDLAMGKLAGKNPLDAVMQVVLPAIIKKFGDDPHMVQQIVGKMTKDQNAQRAVSELIANSTRLYRDAALQGLVKNDFSDYLKNSYEYNRQSVTAQKENVEISAGMAIIPEASKGLGLFADALNKVSDAAMRYPALTGVATGLTAVAGGLLSIAGPITMLLAALRIKGYAKAAADVAKGTPESLATGPATAAGGGMGFFASMLPYLGLYGATVQQAMQPDSPNITPEMMEIIRKKNAAAVNPLGPAKDDGNLNSVGISTKMRSLFNNVTPAIDGILKSIGSAFTSDVQRLPGQVDPAIHGAISAIGAKLAAAISTLGNSAAAIAGPGKQASITVNHTTNLDGKKIAQNTSHHLAKLMEHPTQSAFADGYRGYWPPDMQTITT